MKVILRTADGLEVMVDVDKFRTEIKRPVILQTVDGPTVTHVRIYQYYSSQANDETPIYKEVMN